MKKFLIALALALPLFSSGESILELLNVYPSEQSLDYVANKTQFQLHTLLTEQRHPKTWDLSCRIKNNTSHGIEALLSVDFDISEKILKLADDTALLEQAVASIKQAIIQNKKIYIYGCGATGRLAKQMESSFWRPFWKGIQALPQWKKIRDKFPQIDERLIGEMTGGDRALISSLEGFEDLQLIGKLQLEEHQIEKGDVVFAVTEGGETSSVIGTILAAASQYAPNNDLDDQQKHLYFVYNNPDNVLLPFDRSRSVLENHAITKLCLATGPQSITGSTRMQATTSETFVIGIILEQAIYELLQPHLSELELSDLGFKPKTFRERLLSFLPIQEAVYEARSSISRLTDLEASVYARQSFSIYFAQEALITVFIDSTERAPTFRLFPLDTCDATQKKSWIRVWTPAIDKLDAWNNFLGREFHGLDKEFYEPPFSEGIEDPYLRQAALTSLTKAGDDQKLLYDFSFSEENTNEAKSPTEGDLGVMVLFAGELEQINQETSSFKDWLKVFEERGSKIAVILVSPSPLSKNDSVTTAIRRLAPEALVLQVTQDFSFGDPFKLRQHMAIKMLLNAHSTGVMAKLGRVVGNTMTYVNPGNLKLIGRATFLILSHVNDKVSEKEKISYAEANAVLFDAIEYGKKTGETGQNAEVGLCVIRILEALKRKQAVCWMEAKVILETHGLEEYLSAY